MTIAIMRNNLEKGAPRRAVFLQATGMAVLALAAIVWSAAPGMAGGAVVPMPSKKPPFTSSSIQAVSSQMPMPRAKPARDHIGDAAVLVPKSSDTGGLARTLGLIEPAVHTPSTEQILNRPQNSIETLDAPEVMALLEFPIPPVPKLKPGDSGIVPASLPEAKDKAAYSTKPNNAVEKRTRQNLSQAVSPLSSADADLYRKIFTVQATGDFKTANALIADLNDRVLMGHVLYQRYMHPDYKTGFDELHAWMSAYSDHPGADKIFKLASLRRPPSFEGKINRVGDKTGVSISALRDYSYAPGSYVSQRKRSLQQHREIAQLERAIRADIRRGAPTKALRRLGSDHAAKLMDSTEYDQVRGQIAHAYFLMGKPDDALSLAEASIARSGSKAPMAGWAGGLAAWTQEDYKRAAVFFESTAESPYVNSWLKSAAAYWASRAHMRSGNMKQVSHWLQESANHPRTFYGLIATRSLGWDSHFNWSSPATPEGHIRALSSIPAAMRAMALVQAGQNHLAEQELLKVDVKDSAIKEALLAYAHQAHLPGLAMRLANHMKREDGSLYDSALYPLVPWEPRSGFAVDRALIHAVIRQESKFNTLAESPRGASGLMQIMPATASYIGGKNKTLTDPQVNLDLGQKYIVHLLDQPEIGNDLLSMAVAYNAGPGNLRKWKREIDGAKDDPLLFIEMIPMVETRNYVERVMANYWIYAMRLNQPQPSLDAVAEGKAATYMPMDDRGATIRLTSVLKPFKLASN